jgi:probable HAF family extracellular repeat protein
VRVSFSAPVFGTVTLISVLAACSGNTASPPVPGGPVAPLAPVAAEAVLSSTASPYRYTTLDFPGAVSTVATGINDLTQIVGYYTDGSGNSHAFILANRHFKAIALTVTGVTIVQSQAWGINNHGSIVGNYVDSTGEKHGFVLKAGTVTPIDVPGSNLTRSFGAFGINKAGDVVGQFCSTCFAGVEEGYLLSGGTFTTLDYPGSDGPSGAASSINDYDHIVGYWEDTGGGEHGFKLVGSTYTSIDVPNASATLANGVNDRGQISGWYADSTGVGHGFVLAGTKYTTLDVPGVESSGGSREACYSINLAGDVVGYYVDTTGKTHGFAAIPKLLIRSF